MKTKRIAPVHPGEILLHDFMDPLGLTQYALAKAIGVTPMRISQIVRGQRAGDRRHGLTPLPLLRAPGSLVAGSPDSLRSRNGRRRV